MHSSSTIPPNSNSEEKYPCFRVTFKMQNIQFIQHTAGVPVIALLAHFYETGWLSFQRHSLIILIFFTL